MFACLTYNWQTKNKLAMFRYASNKSLVSTRSETYLQSNLLFSIRSSIIDDAYESCEPVLSDQILLKKAFKFVVAERRRSATVWREQRDSELQSSLHSSNKVLSVLFKHTILGRESRIQSFIGKMCLGRLRRGTPMPL